ADPARQGPTTTVNTARRTIRTLMGCSLVRVVAAERGMRTRRLPDQNRDNGDDHSGRPASLETSRVADDRSVAELHGIAPGEMDLTGTVGVHVTGDNADDPITVRGHGHGHPDALQGPFGHAGMELDFAAAREPSKVGRGVRQDKR